MIWVRSEDLVRCINSFEWCGYVKLVGFLLGTCLGLIDNLRRIL